MTITDRLAVLGLTLPEVPPPAASYLPWVRFGKMVQISGQIARDGTVAITGRVGDKVDLNHARHAARACSLAIVAQIHVICDGDSTRLRRIVRIGGFVNAAPGFTEHPKVIDACSDLLVKVFGETGRHARAAVGCSS